MLLSQSFTINNKSVRNRIVVPPMADFGLTKEDGLINERHLQHYGAFAKGGAGVVIVEGSVVTKMKDVRNSIGLYADECIEGLSNLASEIKKDSLAFIQIMHNGLIVMNEKEIADIPRDIFLQFKQDFIDAAVRCYKAGFDGVELHAAHGYYLNQIVETSTREDEYGGCFENRMRLLVEIIQEIKNLCGQDFIVGVRFGNNDEAEMIEESKVLEAAGADFLDVSTGMGKYQKPVDMLDTRIRMAGEIKKVVKVPVICVGGIMTGEAAEEYLQKGYADFVAVGRGHLADPAWGGKVLNGKEPKYCLQCKKCLWFIDGRKCPVRMM